MWNNSEHQGRPTSACPAMGRGCWHAAEHPAVFPSSSSTSPNHAQDQVVIVDGHGWCRYSRSIFRRLRTVRHVIVAKRRPPPHSRRPAGVTVHGWDGPAWPARSASYDFPVTRRAVRRGDLLYVGDDRRARRAWRTRHRSKLAARDAGAHLPGHEPVRGLTWRLPSCRCSTPTPGACPTPALMSGALASHCQNRFPAAGAAAGR